MPLISKKTGRFRRTFDYAVPQRTGLPPEINRTIAPVPLRFGGEPRPEAPVPTGKASKA